MKRYVCAAIAAVIAVLFFAGCGAKKAVWLNDFDSAQAIAKKQNKNIFLFFSANDWDEVSENLKTTVFETDEFLKGIPKTVPVNLDFSNSLYELSTPKEDASDEERAAAEKIRALLDANGRIAEKYSVMGLPAFYLLTKEGYVISALEVSPEIDSPEAFLALLTKSDEQSKQINDLIKTISKTKGVQKVNAIDTLFETTDARYRTMLSEYFPLVFENDPENATGLLGKYELQNAYTLAMEQFALGSPEIASEIFAAAASDDGHLDAEQKQEALYFAAYSLANSPENPLGVILEYLSRAYEAAPDSYAAMGIQETMQNLIMDNAISEDGTD